MAYVRFLALSGLAFLLGCSAGGPTLTAVSGTVTLDDKPLAGALVKFFPQGETQGHGGHARTGEDGRYEILPQRLPGKGLLPGQYKVIVSRLVAPDGTLLPPDAKPIETASKESVPEPYTRSHLTPLNVTVGVDAVTFNIPLKN